MVQRHDHLTCGLRNETACILARTSKVSEPRGSPNFVKDIDIQLFVQHVLNCGDIGSRYGDDQGVAYQWVYSAGCVAYTTGQPYMACSAIPKKASVPMRIGLAAPILVRAFQ